MRLMFGMGHDSDGLHILSCLGKGTSREMDHARMLLWRDLDSGFWLAEC